MKKINLVILLIMSLTAAIGGEAQSLSSTGRSVEQKLSQTNTQAQSAAAQGADSESVIEGFSNLYVSWLGGYENFDKGYYGIGYESFLKSGVMFIAATGESLTRQTWKSASDQVMALPFQNGSQSHSA